MGLVNPLFLPLGAAPASPGVDPGTLPLSPTVPVDPSLLAAIAAAAASATVTIKRGATIIVDAQPATLKPPTTEQVAMDGGQIRYQCAMAPAVNIRENDLLFVTVCASNPYMVSSTIGRSISDVRQEGDPVGATLFMADFKAQP